MKYHKIIIDGIIYEYTIKQDNEGKHLSLKGIVTYPELMKIKQKLTKKYKWLK